MRPACMPPLISFLIIEQIRMRVPADATGREVSFGGTAGGRRLEAVAEARRSSTTSRRTVEAAARTQARAWRWRLEGSRHPQRTAPYFLLASTGGGGGGSSGFLGGGGAAPGASPLPPRPPTRARVCLHACQAAMLADGPRAARACVRLLAQQLAPSGLHRHCLGRDR